MTQKLRTKEIPIADGRGRTRTDGRTDCVTYRDFDWTAAARLNRLAGGRVRRGRTPGLLNLRRGWVMSAAANAKEALFLPNVAG